MQNRTASTGTPFSNKIEAACLNKRAQTEEWLRGRAEARNPKRRFKKKPRAAGPVETPVVVPAPAATTTPEASIAPQVPAKRTVSKTCASWLTRQGHTCAKWALSDSRYCASHQGGKHVEIPRQAPRDLTWTSSKPVSRFNLPGKA